MSEIIRSLLQDNEVKPATTSELGDFGEKAAVRYLVKSGYRLVASNFRTPVGRNRKGVAVTGEIDVIAFDGRTLCFIEVKTRTSEDFISAFSAVNIRKQRQITRTARVYRNTFNLIDLNYRYDVVTVVIKGRKAPKINLKKAFWTEAKFKKNKWSGDYF